MNIEIRGYFLNGEINLKGVRPEDVDTALDLVRRSRETMGESLGPVLGHFVDGSGDSQEAEAPDPTEAPDTTEAPEARIYKKRWAPAPEATEAPVPEATEAPDTTEDPKAAKARAIRAIQGAWSKHGKGFNGDLKKLLGDFNVERFTEIPDDLGCDFEGAVEGVFAAHGVEYPG